MSQHDLTIDNQGFPSFRSDLNNALQALGTLSSGSTEPSTTFAYQFWADTANDLLKQRNSADTAWIDILTLSTGEPAGLGLSIQAYSATLADLVSKSGTYTTLKSGRKNAIINGNFDVWQRGTGAFTTNDSFVGDRWKLRISGATASCSQASFTLGQTDVPNEPTYYSTHAITTASTAAEYAIIGQYIENVRTLAGQTAMLSFYAKADASKDIAVEFEQSFGTGGSPSAAVTAIGVTTCSLTTSWQKFEVEVTIPSISGKTLGSDNTDALLLNIWLSAGSDFNSRTNSLGNQSGTFDIAQVQLEAGAVATDFEHRSYGEELALCQRYYEYGYAKIYVVGTSGTTLSTSFSVAKRTAPTVSIVGGTQQPSAIEHSDLTSFKTYKTGAEQAYNWTADAEL